MDKKEIIGGATIWARQAIESEIFLEKPAVWFKIWFYLVNKVCFKDEKNYKRGEYFLKYDWIKLSTRATKNQIDGFIRWAKDQGMLETKKTTRGMLLKVVNYSHYQTLDNYYYRPKTENCESSARAVAIDDTETETENDKKEPRQEKKRAQKKTKTDTETDDQPTDTRNKTDTILKNAKNARKEEDNKSLRAEPAGTNDDQEILTPKDLEAKRLSNEVNEVLDLFYKTINPNINFGNTTTRKACEFLIKKYGLEPTKRAIEYAISVQGKPYAPTIITPYQLKEKMSALVIYRQKEQSGLTKNNKGKDILGL